MKSIFEWAKPKAGKKKSATNCSRRRRPALSDAAIEKKVAEMEAARQSRNFQPSDAIRAELATAGILVEITKDGVRWRRK